MISVFISHNYMDKPLARKISNALNSYGIQTWIDEAEIKVGDSLITKIRAGIDQVDYIIALISKYSVESEWVLKELDIAMNKEIEGKRVVVLPILAGKCNLPGFLAGKLYVDMSTKKTFTKNLPQLLSRFNIESLLPENELVFTSLKLSLFDIIHRLSDEKADVRISTWKSLSYSDKKIFMLDEFRSFVIERVQKDDVEADELIELLNVFNRCTEDDDTLLDTYYILLLNTNSKKLLSTVIRSIIVHKINREEVITKILDILKITDNKSEILACLKYFYSVHIYDKEDELLEVCDSFLESNSNPKVFNALIKTILYQFGDDEAVRRMVELYSKSDDSLKKEIVAAFSSLGSEGKLISFYIQSPRLRDKFRNIILGAFSEEDDLFNADIICALFVTDELGYIFPRYEIWDIVNKLDNYSIIALLEKIFDDYNVSSIFYSVEDVVGFSKILDRADARVNELVFDIIADIPLKVAVDVLNQFQYEPKYYNVDNIIITLLKETKLSDYTELYSLCRKVRLENCDEIQKILILLCDYMLDSSKISELVSGVQIDLAGIDMEIRQRRRTLRFLCDILDKQSDLFDRENLKIIKQFIKKAERYYKMD